MIKALILLASFPLICGLTGGVAPQQPLADQGFATAKELRPSFLAPAFSLWFISVTSAKTD